MFPTWSLWNVRDFLLDSNLGALLETFTQRDVTGARLADLKSIDGLGDLGVVVSFVLAWNVTLDVPPDIYLHRQDQDQRSRLWRLLYPRISALIDESAHSSPDRNFNMRMEEFESSSEHSASHQDNTRSNVYQHSPLYDFAVATTQRSIPRFEIQDFKAGGAHESPLYDNKLDITGLKSREQSALATPLSPSKEPARLLQVPAGNELGSHFSRGVLQADNAEHLGSMCNLYPGSNQEKQSTPIDAHQDDLIEPEVNLMYFYSTSLDDCF